MKAVQPKDGYGILDYSHGIKQQNSKDLSEREFGEHKWYDPHTGKMDDAGSNYAGRKRKPRYDWKVSIGFENGVDWGVDV